MLTDLQRSNIWEFIRSEAVMEDFEAWLYADDTLEAALGEALYLDLIGCDFRIADEVLQLRSTLRAELVKFETCVCAHNHRFVFESGAPIFVDGYTAPEPDLFFASLWCVAEIELSSIQFELLHCDECNTRWLLCISEYFYGWGAMALRDDDLACIKAGRRNTRVKAFELDVNWVPKVDGHVPSQQNSFVPVPPRRIDFRRFHGETPFARRS